jgi:NADH-ubiquinone oxidoreductase chain 5
MTKSAQIPFSAWLPAAMAAPTPVSALVHSSTLVTAGVYLLIRFRPLLRGTTAAKFLLLMAGLTIFIAGLGANFEYDLKKIIALSTLSQLGLIISVLAIGLYKLAYFHLLAHALFKALLFMCAGAVIHNMKDSQDIRNIGRLVFQIPYTVGCIRVANLALCGMPFLAGFYSKDLILEVVAISVSRILVFFLYFVSTGLTVCYSARLVYYSLRGTPHISTCHPMNDERFNIFIGIGGLIIISVLGGSTLSWWLFPTPLMVCLPLGLKTLALAVRGLGAWIGLEMAKFGLGIQVKSLNYFKTVSFRGSIWFIPLLFTLGVSKLPLVGSYKIIISGDQGWSELLGGQGLFNGALGLSIKMQNLQLNDLKIYLTGFVI